MTQLLADNNDRERWFCLPRYVQADILEAFDPDWITHFCNDEDKAWRAYFDDREFQLLIEDYHASL
jgi:hypothetical protein